MQEQKTVNVSEREHKKVYRKPNVCIYRNLDESDLNNKIIEEIKEIYEENISIKCVGGECR